MFIKIRIGRNNKEVKFLFDSGASVCVLKEKFLEGNILNGDGKIVIKGISGSKQTLGDSEILLNLGKIKEPYVFHIVEDNFPIDAIIGSNFLRDFNAIIDLEQYILRLKIKNSAVGMPLLEQNDTNIVYISPLRNYVLDKHPAHRRSDFSASGAE